MRFGDNFYFPTSAGAEDKNAQANRWRTESAFLCAITKLRPGHPLFFLTGGGAHWRDKAAGGSRSEAGVGHCFITVAPLMACNAF